MPPILPLAFLYFISLLLPLPVFAMPALTMTEVAEGIYVHFGKHQFPDKVNHGAIANIGFIVGTKCVAVIDTGGNPEQGYALKKAITHTTRVPICYVINTHVHPDHIYGNIAFEQAGVTFIGHQKLPRAMATRGDYYLAKAKEQLALSLSANNIIPPTKVVKRTLILDLGGRQLVLTAHPTAHTDNDLSVLDKKTNSVWLSDLLFVEHIPVIDGSLKGWLKELARLEKKPYRTVIPGHGDTVQDWPKSMQPQKEYLSLLLTQIRQLIKQGKFLEQALVQVGITEKNKWRLFEQYHKRNITTAFSELEWEND